MKRRFHPEVGHDIEEAADWYEERKTGLGGTFLAALESCLERIEEQPALYQRVRGAIRRAPLPRPFPHGVFYRSHPEVLEVLAVLHPARNPRIWSERGR
ncbi:MAG TPA: type II toxin-antitoxin system RelE/ParE family toxin [Thermoanaerobaculia bacterium]|nr:type II toxin-antitoxin system RelE/ParE family toxin [Thermoanaerobaculia bacterium]